jgi:hypothetical protein
VRWLRRRDWFWPRAFWLGCRSFGGLLTGRAAALIGWAVTVAAWCGVVVVIDPFWGFVVVVALLLWLTARGAHLMWRWERERAGLGPTTASGRLTAGNVVQLVLPDGVDLSKTGGVVDVHVSIPQPPAQNLLPPADETE